VVELALSNWHLRRDENFVVDDAESSRRNWVSDHRRSNNARAWHKDPTDALDELSCANLVRVRRDSVIRANYDFHYSIRDANFRISFRRCGGETSFPFSSARVPVVCR
jgi:hypothetical protein